MDRLRALIDGDAGIECGGGRGERPASESMRFGRLGGSVDTPLDDRNCRQVVLLKGRYGSLAHRRGYSVYCVSWIGMNDRQVPRGDCGLTGTR